jgi:hypothetical protein
LVPDYVSRSFQGLQGFVKLALATKFSAATPASDIPPAKAGQIDINKIEEIHSERILNIALSLIWSFETIAPNLAGAMVKSGCFL